MPTDITCYAVRDSMEAGAQVVEVLPAEEFAEAHIPGATNIPLKQLNARTASRLDRSRIVIPYCYDYQ